MIFSNFLNPLTKSRSKSKALNEEQYPPCFSPQNAYSNYAPQHPPICAYSAAHHHQPHLQTASVSQQMPYHQHPPHHQVFQHTATQQPHQPTMQTIPLSTCVHQCPSQHLIQSSQHQHQQHQQSVPYPVHNQMRTNVTTNTLESRALADQQQQQQSTLTNGTGGFTMIGNGHHHHHQMQPQQHAGPPMAQHQPTFIASQPPAYPNSNVQSPITNHQQSARYDQVDNSYYSNNQIATVLPQQPQHQQRHQLQMTQQVVLQQQQSREKTSFEERQQQQDLLKKQQQLQQNAQTQRQMIIQQQQQYQNHQVVNKVATTNGHAFTNGASQSDFPLEVLCKIHDKDYQDLTKMSEGLRDDLSKLSEELAEIRKDTPDYSVNELKI